MGGVESVFVEGGGPVKRCCLGRRSGQSVVCRRSAEKMNGKKLAKWKASFVVFRWAMVGVAADIRVESRI